MLGFTGCGYGCQKQPNSSFPYGQMIPGELEVFLVSEHQVLTKVTEMEAPLVLLAAYYTYNMSYPKGTSCFFSMLEIKLCELRRANVPAAVYNVIIGLQ